MNRFALDNGTRLWHYPDGASAIEITGLTRKKVFSDQKFEILTPAGNNVTYYTRILFPHPVDTTDIFVANRVTGGPITSSFYISTNTTDGFDGTWTNTGITVAKPNTYETGAPQAVSYSGVRGVNWSTFSNSGGYVWTQHIAVFGSRSTNSLHLIETATTNPVHGADLNYGSVQRGITDSTTYSFRVRNGGSLTANGVTISTYIHTLDGLGNSVAGLTFSNDGGSTWHNKLDLGNLTAGSNSVIINMKLTTFSDMPIGMYRPRIALDAASWS